MSRKASFWNRFLLYPAVFGNEISFAEISAVSLIVGWKLLPCLSVNVP